MSRPSRIERRLLREEQELDLRHRRAVEREELIRSMSADGPVAVPEWWTAPRHRHVASLARYQSTTWSSIPLPQLPDDTLEQVLLARTTAPEIPDAADIWAPLPLAEPSFAGAWLDGPWRMPGSQHRLGVDPEAAGVPLWSVPVATAIVRHPHSLVERRTAAWLDAERVDAVSTTERATTADAIALRIASELGVPAAIIRMPDGTRRAMPLRAVGEPRAQVWPHASPQATEAPGMLWHDTPAGTIVRWEPGHGRVLALVGIDGVVTF